MQATEVHAHRTMRTDARCVGRTRVHRQFAPAPQRRPDRFVEVRRVDMRPRSTSAATYRRRRAVVGALLAVLVSLTVVAGHDVLAGSGGDPASATSSQPARASATVIAQPGQSLWDIAAEHHGSASITRYLDTLVDLNGGATIEVGQSIVLP